MSDEIEMLDGRLIAALSDEELEESIQAFKTNRLSDGLMVDFEGYTALIRTRERRRARQDIQPVQITFVMPDHVTPQVQLAAVLEQAIDHFVRNRGVTVEQANDALTFIRNTYQDKEADHGHRL